METIRSRKRSEIFSSLREYLDLNGYSEYLACFNPLSPRPENWLRSLNTLPEHLQNIVKLFALGKPVFKRLFDTEGLSLLSELQRIGLVELKGSHFHLCGLSVIPVLGIYYFCHAPQIAPTLYYGDDSFALLSRLRPKINGEVLDLCCGPGIQSIFSARFARQVVGVDINPVATGLSIMNAEMNSVSEKCKFYHGDLFEPVANQKFDSIIANPPLLPVQKDSSFPFVGDGGEDGMSVTWRILAGASSHLKDRGVMQIIGTCLSTEGQPKVLDQLRTSAIDNGLNIHMHCISIKSLKPGTEYHDGLIWTSNNSPSKNKKDNLMSQFLSHDEDLGLCSFFLHCTLGAGSLTISDLSPNFGCGLWYI